jgi:transcription initiation factor TFIIIB Brf1 subunit/transcription initiation factor TFIIB
VAACVETVAGKAGEQITQTQLAEIADVTPMTIRVREEELRALSDDKS